MAQEQTFTCGNVAITHMVIGPIQTNVYVVRAVGAQGKGAGVDAGAGVGAGVGAGAFVVDPADDCPRILAALRQVGASLEAIVVTHAHFDHTGALAQLRAETGAPVIASAADAPAIENPQASASSTLPPVKQCKVDRAVNNGDTLELCGMKWQVLLTPGHTKGSMCLYLPASENGGESGVLFSGDTLFCGSHGRTDFPTGSASEMRSSLERLSKLPQNTKVFPGHMQFTSIGDEQRGVFLYAL